MILSEIPVYDFSQVSSNNLFFITFVKNEPFTKILFNMQLNKIADSDVSQILISIIINISNVCGDIC